MERSPQPVPVSPVPRTVAEGLLGKKVVTCYRVTESSWLAAVRERNVIRLVTVTNEEA